MSGSENRTCWKCQRETPADGEFCVHCRAYQSFEPTIAVPTVSKVDPSPPVDSSARPSLDSAPPVDSSARPPVGSLARPPLDSPPRAGAAGRPASDPPVRAEPAADRGPGPQSTSARRGDTLVAPVARRPGGTASLACRGVDGAYTGESVIIEVPAGGEGRIVALLENDDEIVDTYDLSVVGLAGGWWSTEPSVVRLFPAAKVDRSQGDVAKQEIEIVVRPPRSSEATARRWPARIVATSREHRDQVASEAFAVDVEPFYEFEMEAAPTRASGRRRGRLRVHVANTGNAPLDVALAAKDPDGVLQCAFEPDRLTVAPGDRATSLLTVRPPRPMIVGRGVERPFTVIADAGEAAPAKSAPVSLRQRAWIPRWVLTALPVVLACLLAAWLAFPRHVTVPSVMGVTPFHADQILRARGLQRGTVDSVTTPGGRGLVTGQTPLPGKRVNKGTKVDITYAIGTKLIPVPGVLHQPERDAVKALQDAGFSIGDVVGGGDKPEQTRVVKQDPPPGARRAQGTLVKLTVKPVGANASKTTTSSSKPKNAVVPAALAGVTAASAIAALERSGIKPVVVRAISAGVDPGKVIDTSPKAGSAASNGTVKLFVSAGYPEIAYQHDGTVVVARGTDGGQIAQLQVGTAAQNTDPSWGPDGHWLVFRRGDATQGQIWRAEIPGLSNVMPLTEPGHNDVDPAVSPDGRVVAFVRDGTQLCFVPASAHAAAGSCLDAGTSIGRPAWAPSGGALLTLAVAGQQVEVERFTTRRPSSPRASDWQPGALVTDDLHGDRPADSVASVALAPAGPPRRALTANWGASADQYTVRLGPADDGGAPAGELKDLSVSGCEVAWRSDGAELAVALLPSCESPSDAEGPIQLVDPATGQLRRTLPHVVGAKPVFQPIPLTG